MATKKILLLFIITFFCITAKAQRSDTSRCYTRISVSGGTGLSQIAFSDNSGYYIGSSHGTVEYGGSTGPDSQKLTGKLRGISPEITVERIFKNHVKALLGVGYSKISFKTQDMTFNSYRPVIYYHPGGPMIDSSKTVQIGSYMFSDQVVLKSIGVVAGFGISEPVKRWLIDLDLSLRIQFSKSANLKRTNLSAGTTSTVSLDELYSDAIGATARLKVAYRVYKSLYVHASLNATSFFTDIAPAGDGANLNGVIIITYGMRKLNVYTLNAGVTLQL